MPIPRRILVVKLADLGDVITSGPALRALRTTFPHARIVALVTAATVPVLAGSPYVDGVLTFDKFAYDRPLSALHPANLLAAVRLAWELRRQRFDTVVILHHLTTRWGALKYAALAFATGARRRLGLDNGRGWFLTHRAKDGGFGARHEVEYALEVVGLLGAHTDDPRLEVPISPADAAYAREVLGPDGPRPLVAIHPGSGGWSLARRWEPGGFAAVADALAERYGARIVLVGTASDDVDRVADAMRTMPLNLAGRTTIGQLAAVLRHCDLFIGADSGVMHAAAAAGTPTVAIFGPTNPLAWGPWLPPERYRIVRSAPLCSPCAYTDTGLGQPWGCPERTCMRMVTVKQVLAAAEALLAGGESLEYEAQHRERTTQVARPVGLWDHVTLDQAMERIQHFIEGGQARQVVLVSLDSVIASRRDPILFQVLRRAALRLAIGPELPPSSRPPGQPPPVVLDARDLVEEVAARAAAAGWRLFLLGTRPEGVAGAAGALAERHPGLVIAGTHAGSPAGEEEDAIVEAIRQAQPTLLLVGFGVPEQEKWIARNLPRLDVPVAIGVGAALERIAGGSISPSLTADLRRRLGRLWALVGLAVNGGLGGR